jgi:hypothetical protein
MAHEIEHRWRLCCAGRFVTAIVGIWRRCAWRDAFVRGVVARSGIGSAAYSGDGAALFAVRAFTL